MGAWSGLKRDHAKLIPAEGIWAPAVSDTGQFGSDTSRQRAIFFLFLPYLFGDPLAPHSFSLLHSTDTGGTPAFILLCVDNVVVTFWQITTTHLTQVSSNYSSFGYNYRLTPDLTHA